MKKMEIFALLVFMALWGSVSQGEEAFGHPGNRAHWSSAKKVNVGTFLEFGEHKKSLVWFTNAHGILTEAYYPTIDKGQIKDSQILISDNQTFMVAEKEGVEHKVEVSSPTWPDCSMSTAKSALIFLILFIHWRIHQPSSMKSPSMHSKTASAFIS